MLELLKNDPSRKMPHQCIKVKVITLYGRIRLCVTELLHKHVRNPLFQMKESHCNTFFLPWCTTFVSERRPEMAKKWLLAKIWLVIKSLDFDAYSVVIISI